MLPAKIRHRIRIQHLQNRVAGNCWVWQGGTTRTGYATAGMRRLGFSTVLVHRVSYELLIGPIPDGMQIDHLCRIRNCINPRHLEPVTNLENALRSDRATRTHCIRNHPLSGDNLMLKKLGERGRRQCRTCYLMKIHEHDVRRRALQAAS